MNEQIKNLKAELCDIMISERNCQAQLNALVQMEQQKILELQKLMQEAEKQKSEEKAEEPKDAKAN